MHKRSTKFMIGAFIGSTIGAMTTLLFSTAEGKKIQKRLMKKFHEMDHKTGHFGVEKFMHQKTPKLGIAKLIRKKTRKALRRAK
jgi:gas vesicle protein